MPVRIASSRVTTADRNHRTVGEGGEAEMRTYDPADHILYVHLAQDPVAPAAPSPPAHAGCQRLSPGYANASLRARLGACRADTRPALVVLPGGRVAADGPASAASALYLAQ